MINNRVNIFDIINADHIRRARKCVFRDMIDLNVPLQLITLFISLAVFVVHLMISTSGSTIYYYIISIVLMCIPNLIRKIYNIRFIMIINYAGHHIVQYISQFLMLLAILTLDGQNDDRIYYINLFVTSHIACINIYYFYGWSLGKTSRVSRQDIDRTILLMAMRFVAENLEQTEVSNTNRLTQEQINNLPNVMFSNELNIGECTICMDDYQEGESLKQLPCKHFFHPDCINSWLLQKNTCPLCRSVIPNN